MPSFPPDLGDQVAELRAQIRRLESSIIDPNPVWTAPTLLNSWVNYSAAFNPAGYTKLPTGEVVMRGLIKLGTAASVICTLPVGYRPVQSEIFLCFATGQPQNVRIDALNNGNILQGSYGTSSTNGFVSLAGVRFFTN